MEMEGKPEKVQASQAAWSFGEYTHKSYASGAGAGAGAAAAAAAAAAAGEGGMNFRCR